MSKIRNIGKRLIPKFMKEYLKKEVNGRYTQNVNYELNVAFEGRLEDKVAIVTGGSGAIGSAISYRLAAEGATVIVCGRNKDKINKVIQQIELQNTNKSGKAIPAILDVTDENNINTVVNDIINRFNKIDILINNAGGYAGDKSKPIHLQEVSIIEEILDVNLRGSILCARKVAQKMVDSKCGTIINISSIVGIHGKSGMSDYAASKAGIIGFTKSLAIELSKYGINVNCVSPGLINGEVFDKGMEERPSDRNYLGHTGKTDDIASLVAFLCSDEANYITGENIIVDGGRSLGLMGEK